MEIIYNLGKKSFVLKYVIVNGFVGVKKGKVEQPV